MVARHLFKAVVFLLNLSIGRDFIKDLLLTLLGDSINVFGFLLELRLGLLDWF